jgi:hypothetical protein
MEKRNNLQLAYRLETEYVKNNTFHVLGPPVFLVNRLCRLCFTTLTTHFFQSLDMALANKYYIYKKKADYIQFSFPNHDSKFK